MNKLNDLNVEEIVTNILAKNSELDNIQKINLDTKLMDIGINSFKAMQVLIEIEESLQIQFPDNMLAPEIFETFGSLYNAIESLIDTN